MKSIEESCCQMAQIRCYCAARVPWIYEKVGA